MQSIGKKFYYCIQIQKTQLINCIQNDVIYGKHTSVVLRTCSFMFIVSCQWQIFHLTLMITKRTKHYDAYHKL